MPEFVLNRNYTLRTLFGHIVVFKKGQPTHVPPLCMKEAVAIGAECVDGKVDVLGPEVAPQPPMSPDERRGHILAAFKLLEEGGDRESFSGSGAPTKAALTKMLDFSVEKREFEPLWQSYLAEKSE